MARAMAAARQVQAAAPASAVPAPLFGGGPPRPPASTGLHINNARLAVLMLLGAESMLFTPLIGAYVVLRTASPAWPPLDQPRLPILVTWLNTLVLVGSCVAMGRARTSTARRQPAVLERNLTLAALLGIVFLGVQGTEWVRLIAHGLRTSTGVYADTFYALIGLHGLHVLGAVIWLLVVLSMARRKPFGFGHSAALDVVGIYWYYVGGLWLFLFPIVYLI